MDAAIEFLREFFADGIVAPLARFFFFDLAFWDAARASGAQARLPLVVVWLIAGAAFFTLRFRFLNVRAFGHALAATFGAYDKPGEVGEVSHFRALSSALSATIGLGNIAGVAVAISVGGPGAAFWMMVAGFLGMSSKFVECTLAVMYRQVDARGRVSGGPMHYLRDGFAELGPPALRRLGIGLSKLFALLCMLCSFGMASMFQAHQSHAQLANVLPWFQSTAGVLTYGIGLAALVGLVSLGGIRRIGAVAGWLVPFMCGLYLAASLVVLAVHAERIPQALRDILVLAWRPEAGAGGLLGTMITGFRRAAFSNEAGIGSAPIAHAAATTDEPVREGIVALLEPFIDTVVVCTVTALVVVVSGAYRQPGEGVVITSNAFASVLPWFPVVLTVVVFLFAYSTMISWSYYGERCWSFLFGERSAFVYQSAFLLSAMLGVVLPLSLVVDLSDLMGLAMAFINIPGLVLLSPKVARALDGYWKRYMIA